MPGPGEQWGRYRDKYPDWEPNPPYTWGDYFNGRKIGYDHRFTPCGYKAEFRKLAAIKQYCSPKDQSSIKQLPNKKLILPELLVHTRWFSMEPMLFALMDHVWGVKISWKVYARLLLVRRIGAAEQLMQPFDGSLVRGLNDFILYGGSRKQRKELLAQTRETTIVHISNPAIHPTARFIGSCLAEDPTMSLVRPFHWLRAAYIHTGIVTPLGLGEFQKEKRGQKEDLLDLMKSKLSKSLVEDLS